MIISKPIIESYTDIKFIRAEISSEIVIKANDIEILLIKLKMCFVQVDLMLKQK